MAANLPNSESPESSFMSKQQKNQQKTKQKENKQTRKKNSINLTIQIPVVYLPI